jgi:hypothetical protein
VIQTYGETAFAHHAQNVPASVNANCRIGLGEHPAAHGRVRRLSHAA